VVRLNATRASFGGNDTVVVKVSFQNEGERTLKFPKKDAPFDAVLEGNMFRVRHPDGPKAEYLGRMVKRAPPVNESDFVTLLPGQAVEVDVSMSVHYNFDQTGMYKIMYDFKGVHSATIEVYVEGRPKPIHDTPHSIEQERQFATVAGVTRFQSCSNAQMIALGTARTYAMNYADSAATYLENLFTSSSRYKMWFGTYVTARRNLAYQTFKRIRDAYTSYTITFNCACRDPNTYAFVYPASYVQKVVHLCDAFWYAPQTGTDSKAGTLVHEMSHFSNIGNTNDVVYGQPGCRRLAIRNPAQTVHNADTHEYFAENNPALA